MTSRFQQSYCCLNGPKEGFWIDAPGTLEPGSACAVAWAGADGLLRYAVYVLTEYDAPVEEDAQPGDPEKLSGLMYMQSHSTPEKAQDHVHRITTVIGAAKAAMTS